MESGIGGIMLCHESMHWWHVETFEMQFSISCMRMLGILCGPIG